MWLGLLPSTFFISHFNISEYSYPQFGGMATEDILLSWSSWRDLLLLSVLDSGLRPFSTTPQKLSLSPVTKTWVDHTLMNRDKLLLLPDIVHRNLPPYYPNREYFRGFPNFVLPGFLVNPNKKLFSLLNSGLWLSFCFTCPTTLHILLHPISRSNPISPPEIILLSIF